MASLWHPPGARDETPLVERSGARVLLPSARGTRGGALVGQTTAGNPREISFPDDLLRRHHLYVARTRMGKSTLMHHIVSHKLKQKAEGKDPDAIVVVDPHTDLVSGLLGQVPLALMLTQIVDIADNHDLLSRLYPVGRERHGAQDFAYLPECAELVMSVLKVSTKDKDLWQVKEKVMHKLAKASAETIPTIWVNLTVWVARQQGPEEVKRLAEALRLA